MQIGDTYEYKNVVTKEITAGALGSGGLDIFATPFLICWMEAAAYYYMKEQLPEGVFREIITGFCRAPKPLLCFFVVTQGGEIIPIELTKLMCRNGISLLPELLQRFDRFCVFRIQRIDILQNSLCGAVTLRLLVHAVGLMLLLLSFQLRVILHSFILKGREAETNALGLPDDVVLDFAKLLALR